MYALSYNLVFGVKCHDINKLDNLSLTYSRSYLFAGMKYNGIIIWFELCSNELYVAILYLYNMKTQRKNRCTEFSGSTKNMHLTP